MEILNDAQGIILANAIYIYVYAHTDRKRKKRRVIILSHRGKSDINWNCLINFCGQIKCASYRITSYRAGQRFCFRSSWRMKWMKWKGKVTCSSGYIYVQLLATGQLHSFVGIRLFFFFFFFFGSHFYIDNFVTRSYSKLPFSNFWHVSRSSDLLQI